MKEELLGKISEADAVSTYIQDFLEAHPEASPQAKADFMILANIHMVMGATDEEPPQAIKLDADGVVMYLEMAWSSLEETQAQLPAGVITEKYIFQTAILMGLAAGVKLEELRNGGMARTEPQTTA